jgi:hypothetical protein
MFNEFRENELLCQKKFEESLEITFQDIFNCDFIRVFFDDSRFISNLYSVIDDLIFEYGFPDFTRHLMAGDFLFSIIKSNEMVDSLDFVLCTSRDVYLYKIRTRACFNNLIGVECFSYIEAHKKLLIGLREKKIIERIIVRTKNKNS